MSPGRYVRSRIPSGIRNEVLKTFRNILIEHYALYVKILELIV